MAQKEAITWKNYDISMYSNFREEPRFRICLYVGNKERKGRKECFEFYNNVKGQFQVQETEWTSNHNCPINISLDSNVTSNLGSQMDAQTKESLWTCYFCNVTVSVTFQTMTHRVVHNEIIQYN